MAPFTGFICVPVDGGSPIILFHHDKQGFDPSRVKFMSTAHGKVGAVRIFPFAEWDTAYLAKLYVNDEGCTLEGSNYLKGKPTDNKFQTFLEHFLANPSDRFPISCAIQIDADSTSPPEFPELEVKVEWCGKVTVQGSQDLANGNYYHHDVKGFNPSRLKIKGKPVDSSFIKELKTLPLIVPNSNVTEPALQFTDEGLAYAKNWKDTTKEFLGFVLVSKSDGKSVHFYHYDPEGYDETRVLEEAQTSLGKPVGWLAIRCNPTDQVHIARHYLIVATGPALLYFDAVELAEFKKMLTYDSEENGYREKLQNSRSRCIQELAGVEPQDLTRELPLACLLEVSGEEATAKGEYFHYDPFHLDSTKLTFNENQIGEKNEITLVSLYKKVNGPDSKSETLRTDQSKNYYADRRIRFQRPPSNDNELYWRGFVWLYSEKLKMYAFHIDGGISQMELKLPRPFHKEEITCVPFDQQDNQTILSRTNVFEMSNEALRKLKESSPVKTAHWNIDEKVFGSQCSDVVAETLGVKKGLYKGDIKDNYEFVGCLYVKEGGITEFIYHWDATGYHPKFAIVNGTQVEAENVVQLSLVPFPDEKIKITEQGEMLRKSGLATLQEVVGRRFGANKLFGMVRVLTQIEPPTAYSVMHYDPDGYSLAGLNGKISKFSKNKNPLKSALFDDDSMTPLEHLLRNPWNLELSDTGRVYVNALTKNGVSLYDAALKRNGGVKDQNLENQLLKLVAHALDPKTTIDVDSQVTRDWTPWRGWITVKSSTKVKVVDGMYFHVSTDISNDVSKYPFDATIRYTPPPFFEAIKWDPYFVPVLTDLKNEGIYFTDQTFEHAIDHQKISREELEFRFAPPPETEKKKKKKKPAKKINDDSSGGTTGSGAMAEVEQVKQSASPDVTTTGSSVTTSGSSLLLDQASPANPTSKGNKAKKKKRSKLVKKSAEKTDNAELDAQQKEQEEPRNADAANPEEPEEQSRTPTFEDEPPKEKIRESRVDHEKSYSGTGESFCGFLTTKADDGSFLDFFHYSATGYKPKDGFTFNGKQVDGLRILHLVRDVDPTDMINNTRAYFTDEGSKFLLERLEKRHEELTASKV